MSDLDDVRSNQRKERGPRIEDMVDLLQFPDGKMVQLRFLKGFTVQGTYWVKTKKKDGSTTKFPIIAPSFDPSTQQLDSTVYDPWRDFMKQEQAEAGDDEEKRKALRIQFTRKYYFQVISRSLQKKFGDIEPTKKELRTGFKDKDADSETPVRVVAVGAGLASKLRELKGFNTVTSKKSGQVQNFPIDDEKYGKDVVIRYDKNSAPATMYAVQLEGRHTPITEEEAVYPKWDLSFISSSKPQPQAEIKADFESWAARNKVKLVNQAPRDDDDEDDSDNEENMAKTPGKKKARNDDDEDFLKKKKKAAASKDDFDDEDDDFEDEDDEEDEKPKKAKKSDTKKPAKSKSKDEDDEDDFDDDDEDDDEPPKKAKKKSKSKDEDDEDDDEPPKKAKKKSKSKDEDEDDDDFDDEDEDEPPKKAKKKSKSKDEDEDDEPVTKKSKKKSKDEDEDDEPVTKGKKSKKKPKDEDEDEDEDDDFEDEDDEPVVTKKAKKPDTKKSKKKSKDEDEDDEDF